MALQGKVVAMSTRSYKPGTRTALSLFSSGTCYYPDCPDKLLRYIDGEYFVALDIAHIRALEPSGARYDASMSNAERNDFPNLIYLCRPHHKVVDSKALSYPVELLLEWKRANETKEQFYLHATGGPVTQESLAQAISEALTERSSEIESTLARLEESDQEAAQLINELLEEVRMLKQQDFPVNEDTAMMLTKASRELKSLPDSAEVLLSAAREIKGLQDISVQLRDAATSIKRSGGFM